MSAETALSRRGSSTVMSASDPGPSDPFAGPIENILAAAALVSDARRSYDTRPLPTPSLASMGRSVPMPGNPASAPQTSPPASFRSRRFATWSVPTVSISPAARAAHTASLSRLVRIGGMTLAR